MPETHPDPEQAVLTREVEYHENLYSGFAQQHFAKAAVRALRRHMVRRIMAVSGAGPQSRVLSLGCGIGDTEILLAPFVAEIVGVDLSPSAVRQAESDAARAGLANARFLQGTLDAVDGDFHLVIAIFFLHHLPDSLLEEAPARIFPRLRPGGCFYSLDPSRYRLSGALGSLVLPRLMKKYQTPDERELPPARTAALFRRHGFEVRQDYYDFLSSPLAGLFPSWAAGYRVARAADEGFRRVPGLRRLGSNFEIIARRPR